MKFVKNIMDLTAAKELENTKALVAQQQATIAYIAMMSDVELEEDEETQEGANDVQED